MEEIKDTTPRKPYVLLKTLAAEWGIDKSNARKYILRQGLEFVRVRGEERTHQMVLALSASDAEWAREFRAKEGYYGRVYLIPPSLVEHFPPEVMQEIMKEEPLTNFVVGSFYIVQTVPDIDPLRIKLGHALDVERRLSSYHTLSPTAKVVKDWPCRMAWEQAAMDSITAKSCKWVGGEVYSCSSIEEVIQRGDAFFSYMPIATKYCEPIGKI
jgi:hypothetical protein